MPSLTTTAARLVDEVVATGDPEDARAKARYLQAVPGGYADGDRFVGVRVPALRAIAGRAKREMTVSDAASLLDHPIHEVRLLGAILLGQLYEPAKTAQETRDEIALTVIENAHHLDNWDLVDTAAPFTLGPWLLTQPVERQDACLDALAASPLIWRRRLAMVSTLGMMRGGDLRQVMRMAERLVDDSEDLMHKAVGWMLREAGRRDRPLLDAFLDRHAATMPRTTLRYALEKHDAEARRDFMGRRSRPA